MCVCCAFTRASLSVLSLVILCSVYFLFAVVYCHYQFSQLPGKTGLQNDMSFVEWNIKPYTLSHSLVSVLDIDNHHKISSLWLLCHCDPWWLPMHICHISCSQIPLAPLKSQMQYKPKPKYITWRRKNDAKHYTTNDNKKLSYCKDSVRWVKRPFKVTQGHQLLCQLTWHIWLHICIQ